jgi:hypothetical protein
MRKPRPVAVGLSPRLRRLLYVLGALSVVAYVVHTQIYKVYIVNYGSNQEIHDLQSQLERERAKSDELQWEKKSLQGPEGPSLAALRENWGRQGQVRIESKAPPAPGPQQETTYRRLADRLRNWLRGGKPLPAPQ